MSGFRKFVLRGNVVDLAVAVVIGAAFVAVVNAFVKDLITPLIAAIIGKPDFSEYTFTIRGSQFLWGDFINQVISFLLIATVVYFFIVLPYEKAKDRFFPTEDKEKKCPECASGIPVSATRCKFCAIVLPAA